MSALHTAFSGKVSPFLGGFALASPIDGVIPDENALGGVTGSLAGFHANCRLDSSDDINGLSEGQRQRLDSLGRNVRVEMLARHADSLLATGAATAADRSRIDSAWAERGRRDSARLDRVARRDSGVAATSGYHFARELEDISAELLRTPSPVDNSWVLFPRFSINPGARKWGYRRITRTGDASFYVGGNEPIPTVNNARSEILFGQHTLVTSFQWDMFEAMASDFAGSNYVSEGLAACQSALMEFGNQLNWFGSAAHGVYGIVGFPRMPRIYSSTPFDGTASVDDVLAALDRAYDYSALASKGTLKHDTVVMGRRVHAYLARTRLGTVTDTRLLPYWMQSRGISAVEIADELDGTMRNGRSGILFYRRDPRTGISIALGSDFSTLPPQLNVFSQRVYCYMRYGGIRCPDVGAQTLLEVSVAAV